MLLIYCTASLLRFVKVDVWSTSFLSNPTYCTRDIILRKHQCSRIFRCNDLANYSLLWLSVNFSRDNPSWERSSFENKMADCMPIPLILGRICCKRERYEATELVRLIREDCIFSNNHTHSRPQAQVPAILLSIQMLYFGRHDWCQERYRASLPTSWTDLMASRDSLTRHGGFKSADLVSYPHKAVRAGTGVQRR